jgi:hypothetical protein
MRSERWARTNVFVDVDTMPQRAAPVRDHVDIDERIVRIFHGRSRRLRHMANA